MKLNSYYNTPILRYEQISKKSCSYPSFMSNLNGNSKDILEISSSQSQESTENKSYLRLTKLLNCIFNDNENSTNSTISEDCPEIKPHKTEPKKELHNLYPKTDRSALEVLRSEIKTRSRGQVIMSLSESARIKVNSENSEKILESNMADINDFKIYKGTQSGSNDGFWAERVNDRELYYIKTQNGKQNIREYIASQFYKAAGIDTPEVQLIVTDKYRTDMTNNLSEYWVRSKAIAGLEDIFDEPEAAYEGFAVDAWLANWDAVISGNTVLKDGHAVRIDMGGSLDYRAMGKKKVLGNTVSELHTLLDPNINCESAYLFRNMKREDLINSLKRVQSVTGDDFKKISYACRNYVDFDLFTTLQNRQKYLGLILDEAESTSMAKDQTIYDYVKDLEASVYAKYGNAIDKLDEDREKRERILVDTAEQRDSVCSDDDLRQLWEIKKGNSSSINKICARGDGDDSYLVKQLDKAMEKVQLTEDAVLYRVDNIVIDSKLNQRYSQDFPQYDKYFYEDDLPSMDEMIKNIYQEGKIVEEKQFISTSLDKNIANLFHSKKSILYKFNAPKGLKATTLEDIPDRIIPDDEKDGILAKSCMGIYDGGEKEIFIARGFKYKMKNLTFEDGHYVIECDIL